MKVHSTKVQRIEDTKIRVKCRSCGEEIFVACPSGIGTWTDSWWKSFCVVFSSWSDFHAKSWEGWRV